MSAITLNFFSRALNFRTEVKVVLPEYARQRDAAAHSREAFDASVRFPVVYLLHGFTGDYSDWQNMVPIERYAQAHGFAVVMPHGYNSWYRNLPHGPRVETFISEELPAAMEAMLPISNRSEDRFIAGLSMGGAGAVFAALRHPEQYRAMASASAVLDGARYIEQFQHGTPDDIETIVSLRYACQNAPDIAQLYLKLKAEGAHIPPHLCLYGTEDEMFPCQYPWFEALAKQHGLPVQMECAAGRHDFEFWDPAIRRILAWFAAQRG